MKLSEEFLMDNPDMCEKAPFKVFAAYNLWLKKQYSASQSVPYKEKLQKEADRFSKVYTKCVRELFLEAVE